MISRFTHRRVRWYVPGLIAGALAIAMLSASVHAQRGDADQHAELVERVFRALNSPGRLLDDDYLDILAKLQDAVEDYEATLDTYRPADRRQVKLPTNVILQQLRDEKYFDDPNVLLDDIDMVLDSARRLERGLRSSGTGPGGQAKSLLRHFRREMTVIGDLVDNYIVERKRRFVSREQFVRKIEQELERSGFTISEQEALREQIAEQLENARRSFNVSETELDQVMKALRAMGLENSVVVVPMPSGIDATEPPEPPKAPRVPTPTGIARVPDRDRTTSWRSVTSSNTMATIDVEDADKPVFIELPSGDIVLREWDEQQIVADLRRLPRHGGGTVGVARISASDNDQKYLVRVQPDAHDAMSPDDARQELISHIPHGHPVIITHEGGRVDVASLRAGVTYDGRKAQLVLNDIEGPIDISNEYGQTAISDCEGDVEITGAHKPISVTDVAGRLLLTNNYAPIILTDTRGDVRIVNTGETRMVEHSGNVDIENSYGSIDLRDVTGDTEVRSAYGSVTVSDVTGDVRVSNEFSALMVQEIGGQLIAELLQSNLRAAGLASGFDIDAVGGELILVLDGPIKESSQLRTVDASLDIRIEKPSDYKLIITGKGARLIRGGEVTILEPGSRAIETVYGSGTHIVHINAIGGRITITDEN